MDGHGRERLSSGRGPDGVLSGQRGDQAMTKRSLILLVATLAVLCVVGPRPSRAAELGDFVLGPNTEHEACRAVVRFDGPRGGDASDIYCGAWERPSGRITLYPSQAAAQTAIAALCQGVTTTLPDADFTTLKQIACARGCTGAVEEPRAGDEHTPCHLGPL